MFAHFTALTKRLHAASHTSSNSHANSFAAVRPLEELPDHNLYHSFHPVYLSIKVLLALLSIHRESTAMDHSPLLH